MTYPIIKVSLNCKTKISGFGCKSSVRVRLLLMLMFLKRHEGTELIVIQTGTKKQTDLVGFYNTVTDRWMNGHR